jgi:hypothetical protein
MIEETDNRANTKNANIMRDINLLYIRISPCVRIKIFLIKLGNVLQILRSITRNHQPTQLDNDAYNCALNIDYDECYFSGDMSQLESGCWNEYFKR